MVPPLPVDMEAATALYNKRTESAKSITPGCDHFVFDQWPKSQADFPKPQLAHLHAEIGRRIRQLDPCIGPLRSAAIGCMNMPWVQLVPVSQPNGELYFLPRRFDLNQRVTKISMRSGNANDAGDSDGDDQPLGEEGMPVKRRWQLNTMTTRLIHVIVHLKDFFLKRDAAMSRLGIEGRPRHSFWEKAALLFNDPDFAPELFVWWWWQKEL